MQLVTGQPSENEHKDDAAVKFLDNTSYHYMVNALVLAICISAYDGKKFKNLNGVKKDMDTLKKLWKDEFGFEMICNKIDKKTSEYHVTEEEFFAKLRNASGKINIRNDKQNDSGDSDNSNNNGTNNNTKNKYDGLIFVFAGHGYKDGILASDCKRIQLEKIKEHFSSQNVPSLRDLPKIFIIDACRYTGVNLPFENRYRDLNFNESRGGNEKLPKFEYYHPYVNMLEVYGNTRGYNVVGNDEKGGSLVLVLSKYLSHAHRSSNNNNNNNSKYSDMTFQQILHGMKRELHKKTHGLQTIEIHDTLLYDVKFNKDYDHASHPGGTYVNQFLHV